VFDDTPGAARVALQHHAVAHEGTAELNLGHLRHQTDNQRLAQVGVGAELKTEHAAALRAGSGLLLTADRAGDGQAHLDSSPACQQITTAAQLQAELAGTAQRHNARLDKEPDPDQLPAIKAMRRSAEVVQAEDDGGSERGSAVGYTESHLQVSAPAGIAATTPASAVFSAGASTSLAAGQDLNFAAQGSLYHGVKAGISMFTYGKAGNANKPNQETGIRLHAASGKVSSQSQSGATRLTADKLVTVASVGASVNVAARAHVMLTAQGAYLKLEGGNIQVHGPGKIEFKAGMKEFAGPDKEHVVLPHFNKADPINSAKELFSQRFDVSEIFDNPSEASDTRYMIKREDGTLLEGVLDKYGRTARVFTECPEGLTLLVGDGDWEVVKGFDYD
jgi:type VI secretion system secreted protein VgrG